MFWRKEAWSTNEGAWGRTLVSRERFTISELGKKTFIWGGRAKEEENTIIPFQ